MKLKEQICNDFMVAYKMKEFEKKNFLGLLKGNIQNSEGRNVESTDENVLKLVKSIEKSLVETITVAKTLNVDCTEQERELEYLKPYLPPMISEGELRILVKEMMSKSDNKNQGFLTGLFIKENQGKGFDNKILSNIIKEEL